MYEEWQGDLYEWSDLGGDNQEEKLERLVGFRFVSVLEIFVRILFFGCKEIRSFKKKLFW